MAGERHGSGRGTPREWQGSTMGTAREWHGNTMNPKLNPDLFIGLVPIVALHIRSSRPAPIRVILGLG